MKQKPKLVLHNLIEKEGDLYAAICLELDVASQGETAEEAEANLKEAVELYLESVYERGKDKEYIFRPAPAELWNRYYELEDARLREQKRDQLENSLRFETRVYA